MDDDDRVGYGKPPKGSRFKKGHSGNPSGRPGRPQGLSETLDKILGEKVVVTQNGRRKVMSPMEICLRQLIKTAAAGSTKAFRTLLEIIKATGEPKSTAVQEGYRSLEDYTDDELAAIIAGYKPGRH